MQASAKAEHITKYLRLKVDHSTLSERINFVELQIKAKTHINDCYSAAINDILLPLTPAALRGYGKLQMVDSKDDEGSTASQGMEDNEMMENKDKEIEQEEDKMTEEWSPTPVTVCSSRNVQACIMSNDEDKPSYHSLAQRAPPQTVTSAAQGLGNCPPAPLPIPQNTKQCNRIAPRLSHANNAISQQVPAVQGSQGSTLADQTNDLDLLEEDEDEGDEGDGGKGRGPLPHAVQAKLDNVVARYNAEIKQVATQSGTSPQSCYKYVYGGQHSTHAVTTWNIWQKWYGVHGEKKHPKGSRYHLLHSTVFVLTLLTVKIGEWVQVVCDELDDFICSKLSDKELDDPTAREAALEEQCEWYWSLYHGFIEEAKSKGRADAMTCCILRPIIKMVCGCQIPSSLF